MKAYVPPEFSVIFAAVCDIVTFSGGADNDPGLEDRDWPL